MRDEDDLQFAILGPMSVRYRGREVPIRGCREQLVLGSLLLAAGRPASLDRLVETVWADDPPQAAAKAVRNSVSSLRRRFTAAGAPASVVRTEPAGYRLQLDGCYLDAEDFRTRVTDARRSAATGQAGQAAALLRAALGLWRGQALAGLGGPVIEAGAASLDEQHLTAVEECLELELALGRHREAVSELQALLSEHPLRERFAAQLMTALYRSGRQAEALAAYRELAARLADGLGIDPAADIARLHEAILRQDPGLSPPAVGGTGPLVPPGAARPEPAHQDPPPAPPAHNRGPHGWRVALLSACALGAIAVAGTSPLWSAGADPAKKAGTPLASQASSPPAAVTAARDNTDPYADGCKADEKSIDWEPVYWPSGRFYGTLILRYSPACQAVWGYLNGPNSTTWTIHIVPDRPADGVTIPWQFSGHAEAGSWSNVLSTRTGCVYVEAFVSSQAGTGPRARTPCFTGTGPEKRRPPPDAP